MRGSRGFSLIEMVVALAVSLIVTAGVLALVRFAQAAAVTEPALGDRQQRLRVASNAITAELLQAGAPPPAVASRLLPRTIPAILPFRAGPVDADPPATFRADALTVVYPAAGSAEAVLASPLMPADVAARIDAPAGCPIAAGVRDPACGIRAGVGLLVFDATGAYDHFIASGVGGNTVFLDPGGRSRSHTYAAGSPIMAVTRVTYYRKAVSDQLMRYNGIESDAPAVDQVTALRFEYLGSPPTAGDSLVPITAAEMTDGPWRPDPFDPNRYDADLLRIRQVIVYLRLRAGTTAPDVPDLEVSFAVSPRSLNASS